VVGTSLEEVGHVQVVALVERDGARRPDGRLARRGGLGLVREYRLTGVDEAVLQVRSDRQKFQPYGLKGGSPGANAGNYLRSPDDPKKALPGKFMRTFLRGECYRAELAGGGGWGDPFERVPDSVLQDVLDEKISRTSAARDYGVAVSAEGLVDAAATSRLRSARRAAE